MAIELEGGRLESSKFLERHTMNGTASIDQAEIPQSRSMLARYLPISIRAQKLIYLINVLALGWALGFTFAVYSATGNLARYWWLALVNIPGCIRLIIIL